MICVHFLYKNLHSLNECVTFAADFKQTNIIIKVKR